MKELIKAPEKNTTKHQGDSQPIRCRVQNTAIRMLTEMVEYGRKMEEKVEGMQSEMKRNVQGTNSEGKETGTETNSLEQKEEINIQPEQNNETRIPKNEEILWNLQDNFKRPNI